MCDVRISKKEYGSDPKSGAGREPENRNLARCSFFLCYTNPDGATCTIPGGMCVKNPHKCTSNLRKHFPQTSTPCLDRGLEPFQQHLCLSAGKTGAAMCTTGSVDTMHMALDTDVAMLKPVDVPTSEPQLNSKKGH